MSEPEQVTREAIDRAVKEGDVQTLSRLTGIPVPVLQGVEKFTRKQRRQWYHSNRKRLNLPRWGNLSDLKTKENGKQE